MSTQTATCIHVDTFHREGLRICLDCGETIDPIYDPTEAIDAALREIERQGNARLETVQ